MEGGGKYLKIPYPSLIELGSRSTVRTKLKDIYSFLINDIYVINLEGFFFLSYIFSFLLKEFLNLQDENQQLKRIYHEQEQALQELGSKLCE